MALDTFPTPTLDEGSLLDGILKELSKDYVLDRILVRGAFVRILSPLGKGVAEYSIKLGIREIVVSLVPYATDGMNNAVLAVQILEKSTAEKPARLVWVMPIVQQHSNVKLAPYYPISVEDYKFLQEIFSGDKFKKN